MIKRKCTRYGRRGCLLSRRRGRLRYIVLVFGFQKPGSTGFSLSGVTTLCRCSQPGIGIGSGIGWPKGHPRVTQGPPKRHAREAQGSIEMKCFVCNKDGEMGVGREKIAEIAVIADIARDRKKQNLPLRHGDTENSKDRIQARVAVPRRSPVSRVIEKAKTHRGGVETRRTAKVGTQARVPVPHDSFTIKAAGRMPGLLSWVPALTYLGQVGYS
jgi:hypothetical protein